MFSGSQKASSFVKHLKKRASFFEKLASCLHTVVNEKASSLLSEMIPWGPFHKRFSFTFWAWWKFHFSFIFWYSDHNKFYACHDNIAMVSCTKICSHDLNFNQCKTKASTNLNSEGKLYLVWMYFSQFGAISLMYSSVLCLCFKCMRTILILSSLCMLVHEA